MLKLHDFCNRAGRSATRCAHGRWCRSTAPLLRQGFRRSEEHTSELQSLMRISYAVFCLKKKTRIRHYTLTPISDKHSTHMIYPHYRIHNIKYNPRTHTAVKHHIPTVHSITTV